MTDREQFEICYACRYDAIDLNRSDEGDYVDISTANAWHIWQEATRLAKPRWIPVSERLPKVNEPFKISKEILVKHPSGDVLVAYFGKGFNCSVTDETLDDVIEWMEIPE